MKARRVSAVLCSGDLGQSQTFYEQVVGLTLSPGTIPNHLSVRLRRRDDAARLRTTYAEQGRSHAGAVLDRRRRARCSGARKSWRCLRGLRLPYPQDRRSCRHDRRRRQVRLVQRPRWQHARPVPARVAVRWTVSPLLGREPIVGALTRVLTRFSSTSRTAAATGRFAGSASTDPAS